MDYKIYWTQESIENLEEILGYLKRRWTQREVNNFKLKLKKQIELISRNPKIFPVSLYQPRLRKAVLSKQTSIFYEIKDNIIYIAYIFVNYRSPKRLK